MLSKEQGFLIEQLKALADENRLRLCDWLAVSEYNVTQLAQKLDVSEPTVSHHLTRLREAGLVNLRTAGTQRFYRLNPTAIVTLQALLGRLGKFSQSDKSASDDGWIAALPAAFSADDRALLREMTHNGRLKFLPNLRVKKHRMELVLRWLASRFEADRTYTEKEVNAIIQAVHEDFASLRRHLVDMGYLRREKDGSRYWLAAAPPVNATQE